MRVMAIDHGKVRIGVALSDPTGTLASPLLVHERRRRRRQDLAHLARIAAEHGVGAIIVGLPLESDGSYGKKANEVDQFAKALAELVDAPVELWDERWTTVEAHDRLRAAGRGIGERRVRVDAAAAALLLQDYLDARERAS